MPKKGVFEFQTNFSYLNHQVKFLKIHYKACHIDLDPFSKSLGFGFKARGCRARVIDDLFFKNI
jgi:hypothetical protein